MYSMSKEAIRKPNINLDSSPGTRLRSGGSRCLIFSREEVMVVLWMVPRIILEKLKIMVPIMMAEKIPPEKVLYCVSSLYLSI